MVLTAAVLALSSPAALAWGRLGHEVVAIIAEHHLTPEARRAIEDLLGPGVPLPSIASWADQVRHERPETAHWHFLDYPIHHTKPDFDPMTEEGGNVVWAVETRIDVLRDPASTREEKREALLFLVHLMGDLHQPLHCADHADHGGNADEVRWGNRRENLHHVWDDELPAMLGPGPLEIAHHLLDGFPPDEVPHIVRGHPFDWMIESHVAARRFAYGLLPGPMGHEDPSELPADHDDPDLSGEYAHAALPVVERRLLAAGLRLARVLNEIFGDR